MPEAFPPAGGGPDGVALLVAARIAVTAMGGVSSILVGRLLGAQQYGVLSTGLAVSSLALVFGAMGVDQLQIFHGVGLDEARHFMRRVAVTTLVLVAILAACWPGISGAARVCALTFGAANIGRLMLVPWLTEPQRRLRFRLRARRELVLTLTTSACFVVAAGLTRRALAVCLAALVAHLVVLVASGSIPVRGAVATGGRAMLRQGFPYALSSALFTLYFTLDAAILAAFRPDVEVGQYAAAYLPLTAVSAVAIVLNSVILRARLAAEGRGDVPGRSAPAFLRASLALGVLGAAGLAVTGPWAVRVLFGDGFDLAARLVPVLAVAVVPHFVSTWASNTLVGHGRLAVVLRTQVALCAVNVAANLVLVPTFGAYAAAWVTVGTEVLGATLYCWLLAVSRRGPRR